ncbi:MAG: HlyC/CorC family transporter [Myxococcales bacterium]|nr:HlyC/CorC family transporter [Myxococcales bacterium]
MTYERTASADDHGVFAEAPWLGIALAIVLVFLNGFFVAAEFALVKVRPTQIEPHLSRGNRRAVVARHMIRHLDAYLSSTQLGITLASLALGWIGEPAFASILRPLLMRLGEPSPAVVSSVSISVAFVSITALHIVIGELAPKSIAIRKAEQSALWTAVPLFLFYKLTFPAIWLLNHAANGLLYLVGVRPVSEAESGHSKEELRMLLASAEGNPLSLRKREIVDRLFDFGNKLARQVRVPRHQVVWLSTSSPIEASLERARASGYTRFPVCKEGLDEVLGFVHIKDLFHAKVRPESLQAVTRKLEFVPETLPLDRLFDRMQAERLHMVAVVDEYGGVSGIVTLEDVLEDLVGELRDEFDEGERPSLVRMGEGVFVVSGAMLVGEVERLAGIELSDRDEDTLGGVVQSELGRRARVGDRVRIGGAEIEVVEASLGHIEALRVVVDAGLGAPDDEA